MNPIQSFWLDLSETAILFILNEPYSTFLAEFVQDSSISALNESYSALLAEFIRDSVTPSEWILLQPFWPSLSESEVMLS